MMSLKNVAEKILDERIQKNQTKYFIKWRGRSEEENSWEYLPYTEYMKTVRKSGGLFDNAGSAEYSLRNEFCWNCHQSETDVNCTTCNRSYHKACSQTRQMSAEHLTRWRCSTCIEIQEAETDQKSKPFDVAKLHRCLKFILSRILEDPGFQLFRFPVIKVQRSIKRYIIVNPFNLEMIETKIIRGAYKSSTEFFSDLQWIHNNCCALYTENDEIITSVRRLLRSTRSELDSIKLCDECYLRACDEPKTFFTGVCEVPHLIVWAKMRNYPHWPAKLMSIDGGTVQVRFFGDHTNANVPANNCFLYSKENPNASGEKIARFMKAVREAEVHVQNIRDKFGAFNFAKPKTLLNPDTIKTQFIYQMPLIQIMFDEMIRPKLIKMSKSVRSRRKSVFTIENRRKSIVVTDRLSSRIMSRRPTMMIEQKQNEIDIKPILVDGKVIGIERKRRSSTTEQEQPPNKRPTSSGIADRQTVANDDRRGNNDTVQQVPQTQATNSKIVSRRTTYFGDQYENNRQLSTDPRLRIQQSSPNVAATAGSNPQEPIQRPNMVNESIENVRPGPRSRTRLQSIAHPNGANQPSRSPDNLVTSTMNPTLNGNVGARLEQLSQSFLFNHSKNMEMELKELISKIMENMKPDQEYRTLERLLEKKEIEQKQEMHDFKHNYVRYVKEMKEKHRQQINNLREICCNGCKEKFK